MPALAKGCAKGCWQLQPFQSVVAAPILGIKQSPPLSLSFVGLHGGGVGFSWREGREYFVFLLRLFLPLLLLLMIRLLLLLLLLLLLGLGDLRGSPPARARPRCLSLCEAVQKMGEDSLPTLIYDSPEEHAQLPLLRSILANMCFSVSCGFVLNPPSPSFSQIGEFALRQKFLRVRLVGTPTHTPEQTLNPKPSP